MATNFPIRQEVSDDRKRISSETDDFLSRVVTTDYSPLIHDRSTEYLSEGGAPNTAQSESVVSFLTASDRALTGALSASIPMYISLGDRYNNKMTFMMLINPSNMTHGKTSAVSNAYTRKGFITQMWGPNQDILTSTGKTAAFMVSGSGITNLGRRRSFAYANFLAFLYSYRNNGYLMADPTKEKNSLTRVINMIHGVEISYDNQIFTGHFNNFTIDEAAERPFLFDYNFEFVCSTLDKSDEEIRGHYLAFNDPVESAPATLLEEVNQNNGIDTEETLFYHNDDLPDISVRVVEDIS